MMNRNVYKTLFIVLIAAANFALGAQELLFIRRDAVVEVISPFEGKETARIEEPQTNLLLPTPGGKYVFFINRQSGRARAVDFENPGQSKDLDLSSHAPLGIAAFSPTGKYFYAAEENSRELTVYEHRAGVLENPQSLSLGEVNTHDTSLIFNARGTRFYRIEGNALVYRLSKDASEIRRIDRLGGSRGWQAAPGGRYLWGYDDSGWIVVDESRGKIDERIKAGGTGSVHFDARGRRAYALSDEGHSLVTLDTRRGRIIESLALQNQALDISVSDEGDIWLLTENSLLLKRAEDDEFRLLWSFDDAATDWEMHYVKLRSNEGFACF